MSTFQQSPKAMESHVARNDHDNAKLVDNFGRSIPLPSHVKSLIFKYAGREATAAYRIASLGKHENEQSSIQEGILCEPFTYWDWHGISRDEWYLTPSPHENHCRKRRLLWERGRGFRANGSWSAYPAGHQRWTRLQASINNGNRWHVKRIAVSAYTTFEDLEWISENLPALEALDLSLIGSLNNPKSGTDPESGVPDWKTIVSRLQRHRAPLRTLRPSDLDHFTFMTDDNAKVLLRNELERLLQDKENSPSPAAREIAEKALYQFTEKVVELQKIHQPEVQQCNRVTSTSPILSRIIRETVAPHNILKRLKWIGLQHPVNENARGAWKYLLPKCDRLETISIRSGSGYDTMGPIWSLNGHDRHLHDGICRLLLEIVNKVPDTVTTLELRQFIPHICHFLRMLHEQKKTIKKIGIDFGAWVQVYPLRTETLTIHERSSNGRLKPDIAANACAVARHALSMACREAHSTIVDKSMRNPFLHIHPLENSESFDDSQLSVEEKHEKDQRDDESADASYKRNQHTFYRDSGGTLLQSREDEDSIQELPGLSEETDTLSGLGAESCSQCGLAEADEHDHHMPKQKTGQEQANTLVGMLRLLHSAGHGSDIALYALEPEPQNRSLDSIQPFALIQQEDEAWVGCGSKDDLADIYLWLERTFKWRPIFDWDRLMVPEMMPQSIDTAYRDMFYKDPHYMKQIEEHFKLLKQAGIPINLLIGKRDETGSSLYWGWPYDEGSWQRWLRDGFDANLSNIAELVDSLSIFYDLRNPLGRTHLEEIQGLEPHVGPHARCPLAKCVWKSSSPNRPQRCPFKVHQNSRANKNGEDLGNAQKMANKQKLQPKGGISAYAHARIAPWRALDPRAGENAEDGPSDDSDLEERTSSPGYRTSIHHLARRAAYLREAVGWQRFWSVYGFKFSSLTSLRIRMPRCFDMIASWRLAMLLERKEGWKMYRYTDERQRAQTEEDLSRDIRSFSLDQFEHKREAKSWPAGRFLRRDWFWPQAVHKWERAEGLSGRKTERLTVRPSRHWADRCFSEEDYKNTDEREEVEMINAIKRAEEATLLEQQALADPRLEKARKHAAREKKRRDMLYQNYVRGIARHEWQQQLRHIISECEEVADQAVEEAKRQYSNTKAFRRAELEEEVYRQTIRTLQDQLHNEPPSMLGTPQSSPNDPDMSAETVNTAADSVDLSEPHLRARDEDQAAMEIEEWIAPTSDPSSPTPSYLTQSTGRPAQSHFTPAASSSKRGKNSERHVDSSHETEKVIPGSLSPVTIASPLQLAPSSMLFGTKRVRNDVDENQTSKPKRAKSDFIAGNASLQGWRTDQPTILQASQQAAHNVSLSNPHITEMAEIVTLETLDPAIDPPIEELSARSLPEPSQPGVQVTCAEHSPLPLPKNIKPTPQPPASVPSKLVLDEAVRNNKAPSTARSKTTKKRVASRDFQKRETEESEDSTGDSDMTLDSESNIGYKGKKKRFSGQAWKPSRRMNDNIDKDDIVDDEPEKVGKSKREPATTGRKGKSQTMTSDGTGDTGEGGPMKASKPKAAAKNETQQEGEPVSPISRRTRSRRKID